MKIGIDGNEANIVEKVGVHQYAFKVLWGIYNLEKDSKSRNSYVIYLKHPPREDLPKENEYWKYKVMPGKGLWVLTKLMPHLLIGPKPEVFFNPSHYLPPIMTIPSVCTIHDLGYLKFSGQFKKYDYWQLKYWTAISLIVSNYIITFSKSNIRDIVRHYKFTSKKLDFVYHGYDRPSIIDHY